GLLESAAKIGAFAPGASNGKESSAQSLCRLDNGYAHPVHPSRTYRAARDLLWPHFAVACMAFCVAAGKARRGAAIDARWHGRARSRSDRASCAVWGPGGARARVRPGLGGRNCGGGADFWIVYFDFAASRAFEWRR